MELDDLQPELLFTQQWMAEIMAKKRPDTNFPNDAKRESLRDVIEWCLTSEKAKGLKNIFPVSAQFVLRGHFINENTSGFYDVQPIKNSSGKIDAMVLWYRRYEKGAPISLDIVCVALSNDGRSLLHGKRLFVLNGERWIEVVEK